MPPSLTPADRRRLEALQRWATLLDAAFGIPGTRIRFGLDALIGLVPGAGDAVAALFSAALIVQAARTGIPRVVLARMVFNTLVDTIVGAIPFLGDLFDVAWKANLRNVRLLDRFVRQGQHVPTAGDYAFVGGLLVVLALIAVTPVILLVLLISYVT
jgi:hypothetical protein